MLLSTTMYSSLDILEIAPRCDIDVAGPSKPVNGVLTFEREFGAHRGCFLGIDASISGKNANVRSFSFPLSYQICYHITNMYGKLVTGVLDIKGEGFVLKCSSGALPRFSRPARVNIATRMRDFR